MDQWLSALLGGGVVTGGAVTLVLTGKLLPSWVVRRQMDVAEAAHKQAVQDANSSHEREVATISAANAKVLEGRDKEQERLVAERDFERQARGVERDRADANAQALAEGTREFGETIVHLLRSLPELPEGGPAGG